LPSKATSDELVAFDLTSKGRKRVFLFLPTFRREEMLRISHFGEEFYIEGKHLSMKLLKGSILRFSMLLKMN